MNTLYTCVLLSFLLSVLSTNTNVWAQSHEFEEKGEKELYHSYALTNLQASFLSEISITQLNDANNTEINSIELRTLDLEYLRLNPFKGQFSTGYLAGIKAQYIPNGDFDSINLSGGSLAGIVRWNTKVQTKGYGFLQFRSGLNYNIENRIDQLENSFEIQWEIGTQAGWILQGSEGRGVSIEFGPNWNLSRTGHSLSYELSIGLVLGRKK